jgi:hypothetical protein
MSAASGLGGGAPNSARLLRTFTGEHRTRAGTDVAILIGGKCEESGASGLSDVSQGHQCQSRQAAIAGVSGVLRKNRDGSGSLLSEHPKGRGRVSAPVCPGVADFNPMLPSPAAGLFNDLRWSLAHPFKVERNAVGADGACGCFRFGQNVRARVNDGWSDVGDDLAEFLSVIGGLRWRTRWEEGDGASKQEQNTECNGKLAAPHGQAMVADRPLKRKSQIGGRDGRRAARWFL